MTEMAEKDCSFTILILSSLLYLLFCVSCTGIRKPYVIPEVIQRDISSISVEEFPVFIDQLGKLARSHPDINIRLEAHLTIALISVHTANPEPDYTRAIDNLNEYVALSPYDEERAEVRIWMSVLARLDEALHDKQTLQAETREWDQKNRRLDRIIEGQKSIIQTLEKKIRQLDSIFLKIENKRKKKKS